MNVQKIILQADSGSLVIKKVVFSLKTRKAFEEELQNLHDDLMKLGELSLTAIAEALIALKEQDDQKATKVINEDQKINDLEEKINEHAIWLIAKEQPLASDLRNIMSAIKISNDLERIGDLAVNIAKAILIIGDQPLFKPIEDLPKMAEAARNMTEQALEAYCKQDVAIAREVAEKDDEIDNMYDEIVRELLQFMAQKPDHLSQIMQLAFICRFIERVGDHATNIAESTIYLVKGKILDLNK